MIARRALALCTVLTASLALAGPAAATGRPLRITGARADTALTRSWQEFGRRPGAGWAAADGTYSTRLPSGPVVWLFNDTFFGPVRADDSLPGSAAFTHNSAVLSTVDGRHPLATIAPGPAGHPRSLVGPTPQSPDRPNDHWYWNGDGTVDGGKLRVIEFEQEPTDGPPPFNFAWTRTKLATLDPFTFRVEKLTEVPSAGGVQWGTELMRDGAWTFVYGVEGDGPTKYLHLARAPLGRLDGPWQFRTATGWTGDPAGSVRLLGDVGSSFGVTPIGGEYLLTTFGSGLGNTIHAYHAASPAGPFTGGETVYTAPEAGPGRYTYNVAAHPEISRPGHLVVSYNTNSERLADLYADIDHNRPRFVDLQLSR
ncbi:DUF5005 domain-containing protein [Amycolatopsis sp. PS_44_ISF1]|uniref:DUF5005 domain-containing protein n=1 Tax=Amycolatopsis sp. PS_44_ISF1 TaxID=2974917 RepID=UPI0028DFD4A5|nr:DUF5005 domain-containing protein [Amycolatopsis sp. PS_44_ISF1]MDT8913005.1 DUF5005 domain-containing protein [Amycolatopsis sp. PS_44_ISF1]